MSALFQTIRRTPLLWLLALVPVVFAAARLAPGAHTLLFVLSVLAIIPLAVLLSHATEAVAARLGDAVGGLLSATLGNLTELVIGITALQAGQHVLVKAALVGSIVTKTLFMTGASLLLGGVRYHTQEFNRATTRLQAALLFLAAVALLVPSTVVHADAPGAGALLQPLSFGLSVLLIMAYGLGMLFSLGTHREFFASAQDAHGEASLPMGVAMATLAVVTVLVALTSEIFVESMEVAGQALGLTPAFVGFVVVPLVGGAPELTTAVSAARKDRLDLGIGMILGSATQMALFVAPALVLLSTVVGPGAMDLVFWPGAVMMLLVASLAVPLITSGGRSAWFLGALLLMVYLVFAMALYLVPPRAG